MNELLVDVSVYKSTQFVELMNKLSMKNTRRVPESTMTFHNFTVDTHC